MKPLMNKAKVKILYFIQLPPPHHGVSMMNSQIYHSEEINNEIDKLLLEIRFSQKLSELRRLSIKKIKGFIDLNRNLHKILEKEHPDYLYFSFMPVGKGFWRDLLFIRTIKKFDTHIIYHLHNRGIGKRSSNLIWKKLYRYVFSNSLTIHLSQGLMEKEIFPLKIPNLRSLVVPNGVPAYDINGIKEQPSSITLLFCSNIFPQKGIYDLLKIMSEVSKQRKDICLRIVGEFMRRRFEERLLKLIDQRGLKDFVTVEGPKYGKDKESEYLNADVFIFPSYFSEECFPLVILEAMSFQLPIVSSNIGAIPEIIENGKEGVLVNPRDINGFVEAVIHLAEHKTERQKIGIASRKKFQGNYTIQHLEKNIKMAFTR
ncbi:MAG TPA: glycosyltransferase family 1 protein [Bacteroides sp.]|nr:glycosyltransferase family 1 protein [Bacteroides sp.]